MKTIVSTKLQTFCVRMSILVIGLLPFSLHAQNGENDPTFNKSDKIAGQGANNVVEVSALQPDGKILIAGEFMYYNGVGRTRIARVRPDGSLDNTFNARGGTSRKINAIAVLPNDKILVAGNFTAFDGFATNGIVRLNANGRVDKTFNSGLAANSSVSKMVLQSDGKILVVSGTIFRLNKNGSIDNSFHAIITDTVNAIQQLVVQADDKIVIAGQQDRYNPGNTYSCGILRLNKNGDRDFTFKRHSISSGDNPIFISSVAIDKNGNVLFGLNIFSERRVYLGSIEKLNAYGNLLQSTSNFWSNSILMQTDGKLIVTGLRYIDSDITWYILQRTIVRLNEDLTIDSSFIFNDKKTYSNIDEATFNTGTIQMDGKILLGGKFAETCGLITNNIARLNPNGSLDPTFNLRKGFDGVVLTTAIQVDEKILVGGGFSRFNYQFISNIARLKKNGEIDPSFQVGSGTNGRVHTIALQANGKILIGGSFTSYDGHSCSNIARLTKNGSFDESFSGVTADHTVRKIGIDRNGKIIVAGDFKTLNGIAKPVLARFFSDGTIDTSFHFPIAVSPWGTTGGYDFSINTRGQIYVIVNVKSSVDQTHKTELIRLQRNGGIDHTFTSPEQEFYEIQSLALNNDGNPIIGGLATNYNVPGGQVGFVAQLNADGSKDSNFQYSELKTKLNNGLRTITVLENDKLIIGGDFFVSNSTLFDHITILNKDGSLEIGEDVYIHADNAVYTATRNANAQLIIAGTFGEYNTAVRNGIARINIEVPFDSRLSQPAISFVQSAGEHFNIYPNPASSSIHIENLKPGSEFKIFNAIGKEVYSGKWATENGTIELSDYLNGMYFIVAEIDGKRTVNKFIVSK